MTFASPAWLLGLLFLPVVVVAYVLARRKRRQRTAALAAQGLFTTGLPRGRSWRLHVPFVLFLVALALLVVASARPMTTVKTPRREATVVLAIDARRAGVGRWNVFTKGGRHDEDREGHGDDHPADDRPRKGRVGLAARAKGEGHRDEADHRGERGHQDGAQPHPGRVLHGLPERHAVGDEAVGELHDEDAV